MERCANFAGLVRMKNNMAYFDEKRGEIVLSEEDKEIFKEVSRNVSMQKTPWANSIINKLMPKELQNENIKNNMA